MCGTVHIDLSTLIVSYLYVTSVAIDLMQVSLFSPCCLVGPLYDPGSCPHVDVPPCRRAGSFGPRLRGMASEIFGWGEPSNPSSSAYVFYSDWFLWPASLNFKTHVCHDLLGRYPCSFWPASMNFKTDVCHDLLDDYESQDIRVS